MTTTIEELTAAVAGQTVASAFLETSRARADHVALRERGSDDSWTERTFAQYAAEVAEVTAGLRAAGIGPGDRVVLMMRNIASFHIVDMAVVFSGATPISIYNSSSPEQVAYLAGHCRAKLAIVEDDGFHERFQKVHNELPELGEIINLAGGGREALGAHGTVDLDEAAGHVTPDTLATVIYTSGTTGPPKGVMLSHFNVAYTAESLRLAFGEEIDLSGKRLVSYLPMAHIAERMTSHYLQAIQGYEVTACPDPALLAAYLRDVRPHIMFGVPRVWEKLHAGIAAALAADPEKKAKFDEGMAAAIPIALDRAWGRSTPEQDATWDFLQGFAFGPVKQLVGLDELEFGITGAAPIPAELLSWFQGLGVPLSEIYGMSESSGPMTWAPTRIKPGTVGPAIPGCEVALAEDGEVICRGGNVFLGYLDDEEKTAEALPDGWLHTGDIGVFDDEGYLHIVDRKKELIITAGGKNISPANLEAALKMIPLVAQACAIGDQRPFVSALVVLDPEVAPVWAANQGLPPVSLAELAQHPDVVAEIERGVEEVMGGFNNAERVKKVKVLGVEWVPDSEELTPTSKLKRRGIHARYAQEIEALYET
ncbi:MAG TPA: AMP-dependent synthetase/ligase [Acidimicrobiales bacterium]|nr:AMP-dependent synthetase/ligase [Acidimicrobiales bacterium]